MFNFHLGHENKINNDSREDLQKEEESQKVTESCDLSDILQKMEDDHCDAYYLLVNEFKAFGDLVGHTIVSGPNVGKTNQKQMWSHKYSNHEFFVASTIRKNHLCSRPSIQSHTEHHSKGTPWSRTVVAVHAVREKGCRMNKYICVLF